MPRPALNLPPSASAVGYNAEGETRRAKEESVACDLFLAVGSSLMVYPAAGIPALAKESGAVLVIVNREPTDLDDLADLVINAEIGPKLDAVLSRAQELILALRSGDKHGDFVHIRRLLEEYLETPGIDARETNLAGHVRTGFVDLDTLLGGLKRSDLIILAARPSLGKTSLALNIACNAAIGQGARSAIFSLEMSAEQLAQRLLAGQCGVDSTRLRLGEHNEGEERRIMHAMGVLAETEIYIDDTAVQRVGEIRAKAHRLHREKPLDLIVVDYLQLMQGAAGRFDSRVSEVSDISRALKGLARELDVPVIACSQLSRAPEQRVPHVPMLSDLRESGSI